MVPLGAGCNCEYFPITGCTCVCLFCPCVCRVHVHVHAQPTEHQDSSWTRDYYSSPAFDNRMAPWWVDREVIVWCELFQPQSWHTDYLNSSTCIVLPSLPWLLFSLLCDNPNKQFHSLSFHFSLHSNSSLGLIAGFASFLSLSPSSPPSSISGLINTSTTRCFHCAKGTSTHLHGRPVSLQQGNLFVQARYELHLNIYAGIGFQTWVSASHHSWHRFWFLFCFSWQSTVKKTAKNHFHPHLPFHAGASISLRVREFYPWGPCEKCMVTGKCSPPGDEAVQHLIWELYNHLPHLRQILTTSLFSIKMLLSP